MTTDHDAVIDAGTDAATNESTETEFDESGNAGDGPPDWAVGRLSRRGVLGVLAALGLVGAASAPASAGSTTLEFGGNYTSDPGSNVGLRLEPDNARFGMLGFSETSDGRGLVGRATAASGSTIGVLGRAESPDGVALQGQNDATSGNAFGGFFRTFSTEGRAVLGIAEAASGNTFGAIGKSRSPSGTGVEGNATAGSGTTYGVAGRTNSPDGYGLYTPDDARVGGTLAFSGHAAADTTLDIEIDGERTLHLDFSGEEVNLVNGYKGNSVKDDAEGAVIAGGGARECHCAYIPEEDPPPAPNKVLDDFGTVGGGLHNQAGSADGDDTTSLHATVSGGNANVASGPNATVGGGHGNTASSLDTTVGGGGGNTASGDHATVGGGWSNTASGENATVPGGDDNTADGAYSFAAGRDADANGHDGAFVLGDSTSTTIQAQNDNELRSQMPMYAPSFNTTSARAKKTNVGSVDPQAMLDGVASLEIHTWELAHRGDGRHVGPMAGDFDDQFDLGGNAASIASVDADGVALAAIQALAERGNDRSERIDRLERSLEAKDDRIAELEADNATKHDRIEDLEAANEALRERLAAVEAHLDLDLDVGASGSDPTSAAD